MSSRRFPRIMIGAAAAVVVVAMAAPASGAVRANGKPSALSQFSKSASSHSARSLTAAESAGDHGTDVGEAEAVKLRGEFEQSITAAPGESAPAAGLVAAQVAASALPVSPGTWDEVTDKPFINDPVDRGANFGVGYGNVTGRMTGLTHSGSTVYAASASGGVWRSTNDGKTWAEVNAGLPRLSIGAIATDPSDGSIWAGTGEANNASENQYGVGVFRLANGSSTWQQVGGAELYGAGSFRIVWINGYIYAATSHGLYRRAVGAAQSSAWRLALAPAGVHNYPPNSSVTDVIAVPGTNGAKVLAVVGWAGYSVPPATFNNGFYVGTGASGSFARVTPTGDMNPKEIGRTTFTSSHGWLYAVVQDTVNGTLRAVARIVGDAVDRKNRLTDGRLAIARTIGYGAASRDAHLALMEISNRICRPVSPSCGECPAFALCATREGVR